MFGALFILMLIVGFAASGVISVMIFVALKPFLGYASLGQVLLSLLIIIVYLADAAIALVFGFAFINMIKFAFIEYFIKKEDKEGHVNDYERGC